MTNKIPSEERARPPSAFRLPPPGLRSSVQRAWVVCAKDVSQELRRRVAVGSVFFFAATALTLIAFAIGPFGLPPDARGSVTAALLWVVLFFSAATGLPRAFVREEESGTALALRKVTSATLLLAGKTLFNFLLFLSIATVVVAGFSLLLGWRVGSPGALAATLLLAGYGLSVASTFLAILVARASHQGVLFVLISFPVILPLLLSAIAATLEASRGEVPWAALRVIVGYDGAATCAAYLLAETAWED